MKLQVAPDGLAPGDYTATIRLTVPEALNPTLEIPVTMTVVEPPKQEDPATPGEPVDSAPTDN
jgi:hypothetical protein